METQENVVAQAEELEALRSIYGEENCRVSSNDQFCEVLVHSSGGSSTGELLTLRLGMHFPESYPSSSYPITELNAPWLSDNTRQRVVEMLVSMYEEAVGEVVVFRWVEWLKEQDWLWEEARSWLWEHAPPDEYKDEDDSSLKSPHPPMPEDVAASMMPKTSGRMLEDTNLEELDKILSIVHGEPFTEKKSTFQGHLAPVRSMDEVESVMDALLMNRKIAGATHNIMAYRIDVPTKNAVLQDSDDGGEAAAGGRLLHLLQIVDAINVVVVVSRWYGGILLGPDRFKHINNAARGILGSCGYIAGFGSSTTSSQRSSSKSNPQKGKKR